MKLQDQFNRRSTQKTQWKSLHNDYKGRRGIKSMVEQTAKGWINKRIQVKICNTILLYSKEEQIIMIGTRLQETESSYNKGQNTTISNWRGHQQIERSKIFQQIGLDLRIQQHMNQRRRWMESSLFDKFEPQVMYFGLCNLPGIFQQMMNSIFWELLHEGVLTNYIDNFVIPAKTIKELEERTICFLKITEKHNLCFKKSKCNFNIEEILISGVIVRRGQVQMETDKVKAVKEWKTPTKLKEMESFLGFTNFYRQFIKNFSHMAKPLNKLKGKNDWKWEEE